MAKRERPAIHPGEFLAEELKARSMTVADLAQTTGIPWSQVSELLRGECTITDDTALRLAEWIGSSPAYWLNLQWIYALRLAERTPYP